MFFVPGILISLISFPGVIVHELAQQLFCRWFRVPVFKVVYFQVAKPVGYVQHEPADSLLQSVFISIGPFFVNTILGFLVALPAVLQYKMGVADVFDYALLYLGVSIAMHAFPNTRDAESMWEHVKAEGTPLQKILIAPIYGLIFIGALGSMIWLDLLYGIGVAVGLPWLLMGCFM